jgi:Fe-S cluster biogenesis protein NfuA
MFVQSELTPNPNSIKFLPGKIVSKSGSFEVTKKDETNNDLIKNLFSVNGVESIFLGKDFISVNKQDNVEWEEIKHIIISLINDFYSTGKEYVVEKNLNESSENLEEVEMRIIKILDQKIRPAVARDGGDIKFKEFKDGVVKVQLQGSCSGCPSSTMTLKQGVQNLLCHYIPEVKQVEAI